MNDLADEKVVSRMGLVSQITESPILGISIGHQLIENMVISLDFQLEGNTGLFQKVSLDIGGGNFQVRSEVNTDELTLEN